MSSNQDGAGRREVAYRVFAAEYEDADLEHSENDADERAPNYVVTPTGARANRLFLVGVLTEVDRVNEEMLRGRVVDPTGAFVVYAGQYQPDQLTVLERLEPPAFVAVTGKARTFQPEDSETTYTSIRPESITEVDTDSRDRWTVQTAGYTLDRIGAFASALDRDETGAELEAALKNEGVQPGMAAGIPLAIEHYGTTPAYLEDLRRVAIEAAEVVAGRREEVGPLERSPADRGDLSLAELLAALPDEPAAAAGAHPSTDDSVAGALSESAPETTASTGSPDTETKQAETATVEDEPPESVAADPGSDQGSPTDTATATDTADPDTTVDMEDTDVDTGAIDTSVGTEATDTAVDAEDTAEATDQPAAGTDELYEFDEEERAEIEAEFDTDFTTGSEIEQSTAEEGAGEALDSGDSDDASADESAEAATLAESAASETVDDEEAVEDSIDSPADSEPTGDSTADGTETSSSDSGEGADEEDPGDVDLETAVVEAMRDLDDGDGASRSDVVDRVSDEHGASESAVDDAIDDALMSGKCYEPGEDRLKAI